MKKFKERFFLRFHMSLILLGAGLFGFLASTLLLHLHLENIVIRYPLAVLLSYLAFFLFVKIWLWYLSASRPFDTYDPVSDMLVNLPSSSPSLQTPSFGGGLGGTSGGGGASGTFDGSVSSVQGISSSGTTDASGGLAKTAGNAVSGIFDDDAALVLIVLGALLAVVFGSSLYLIYDAPHILAEAAFDFLLASSLIKTYKTMDKPDWVGSVFRTTYKPFLLVLLITTVAAWVIHHNFPEVTKMSELFLLF